ncbi:MAG: hypothetical protein Q8L68_07610, partial [Methylococcales bacterium]|nr:hypothetical protein [Methylococcales bacterium]
GKNTRKDKNLKPNYASKKRKNDCLAIIAILIVKYQHPLIIVTTAKYKLYKFEFLINQKREHLNEIHTLI